MRIKYKTTIEETVDCHVRLWWLGKSSRKQLVMNLLFIPVICTFMAYQSDYKIKETFFKCIVFTIIYGAYLAYAYGPGFRRKIRKRIFEALNGMSFPDEVEYEINEEGISSNNGLQEIKSIRDIRPYKQYIELVGLGGLFQIRKEHAPPIEEIIAVWKDNK